MYGQNVGVPKGTSGDRRTIAARCAGVAAPYSTVSASPSASARGERASALRP
jgi:hypothetical protein